MTGEVTSGCSCCIGTFPHLGKRVARHAQLGLREVIDGKYRIFYQEKSDYIEIVDVFHSSQLPPWEV